MEREREKSVENVFVNTQCKSKGWRSERRPVSRRQIEGVGGQLDGNFQCW